MPKAFLSPAVYRLGWLAYRVDSKLMSKYKGYRFVTGPLSGLCRVSKTVVSGLSRNLVSQFVYRSRKLAPLVGVWLPGIGWNRSYSCADANSETGPFQTFQYYIGRTTNWLSGGHTYVHERTDGSA